MKNYSINLKNQIIDTNHIRLAEKILIDTGIASEEASVVLQAIGYTLLDVELYPEEELLAELSTSMPDMTAKKEMTLKKRKRKSNCEGVISKHMRKDEKNTVKHNKLETGGGLARNNDKMKVLVVEPMKAPYTKEIDKGLKSLQNEVGGDIQAVFPFKEEVAVICNDEGKINGLELNRALWDENGKIYDIIAGTFLVCGLTEDTFGSLPDNLINKFFAYYKLPETFIQVEGEIVAIPVEPIKKGKKSFE